MTRTDPTTEPASQQVADLAARLGAMDRTTDDAQLVLHEMMTPTVTFTHDPPLDVDGTVEADLIRQGWKARLAQLRCMLPDYEYVVHDVQAYGDEIHFVFSWRGTLADGRRLDYKHDIGYVVADGAVVEYLTWIDPSTSAEQQSLVYEICDLGIAKLATAG